MREEETAKNIEEERKKQQLRDEIIGQNNELYLMRKEEGETRRILFYKKMQVNKPDMYIDFLFHSEPCEYLFISRTDE